MAREKIKDTPKVKVPEQVREQYRPKKEGRSTFDKVLEQNKMLQKAPQNVKTNVLKSSEQDHVRVQRHQDQSEKGRDRQSDDKEKERGKEKAREERKSTNATEQKVLGKGRGRDGSGQGKGQGKGKGQGFAHSNLKKAQKGVKKSDISKSALNAQETSKFSSKLKAEMNKNHLSQDHIKNIVSKIVKFIKTGINKEGEKEVRLDLRERIFRGLQLRVSSKDGKVSVHFDTSNNEVRELFTASSDKIQEELEKKGITVRDIKVT